MSRPNGAEPIRSPLVDPRPRAVGGAAETLDDGEVASDRATAEATLPLAPSLSGSNEATIEVDHLAFPRLNPGENTADTIAHGSTIPGSMMPAAPDARNPDSHATLPLPGSPPAAPDPSVTMLYSHDGAGVNSATQKSGSRVPYGDQIPDDKFNTDGKTSTSLVGDGEVEIVFDNFPRIPGYQLLSELGRGGMGVVYKARQVKLNRLVALKMVLAGAHASKDQLARFLIEAQAVAHLRHENIVQIFEVNDHDGLPYFSLEYIDGGSLQGVIGGKPQPVRSAAVIVRTLTAAIADAHAAGIIHRDLKPANVLMSKKGEPKITDFGLAKRLEGDSQQTRDGAIMGTPSYMAPEQAWGLTQEIGPSADQHALGAILYEMLTGRPPYQGATALETLDQVRHQEPVPPGRLQPKVPKDLETICLKALEKDAAKRYPDCGAMAGDLQRFLDDQPILARPVSSVERAARWCKRNKKGAAAIGAMAASILLVIAVLAGASLILGKQKSELVLAVEAAKKSKLLAEQEEIEARQALDREREQNFEMLNANREMGMLSNMRLRTIPGAQDARRELIRTAKNGFDRALKAMEAAKGRARQAKDVAFATRSIAGIHQFSGLLYQEVGQIDKAASEFKTMNEMAEKLYADLPEQLESIKALATSKLTLADFALRVKYDTKQAEKLYLQAAELRRRWMQREPRSDIAKQGYCNALGHLAMMYLAAGDPSRALKLFEEEEQIRDSVGDEAAKDSEFRRETAGLYEKMGEAQTSLGNRREGRALIEKSLKIRREVVRDFPGHPQAARDVLLSLQLLGHECLMGSNEPALAKQYYREVVPAFEERLKFDPANSATKLDVARAYYFLATACLNLGEREASDEAYRKALVLYRELAANPDARADPDRRAEMNLMLALARCGLHADAAKIADDVVHHPPKNEMIFFQVACGYALAADAAMRAMPSNPAESKRLAEDAIKALEQALKLGWKKAEDVRTDPDLAPIRNHPAFPALLKKFEAAAETSRPH